MLLDRGLGVGSLGRQAKTAVGQPYLCLATFLELRKRPRPSAGKSSASNGEVLDNVEDLAVAEQKSVTSESPGWKT